MHSIVLGYIVPTGVVLTNWKPLSPSRYFRLGIGLAFGMTDVGLSRRTNEDNFLIDEEIGLVVVGDGMGGHDAGELASAEALSAVREFLKNQPVSGDPDNDDTIPAGSARTPPVLSSDPDRTWSDGAMHAVSKLHDAVEFANKRLYAENLARFNPDGQGMGTTLTGFWRSGANGPLVLFHVGDSRLYRFRGGRLTQLTRDQTLYQDAIDAGDFRDLPPRNLLLQAVGPSASVIPEVRGHDVASGDLYLLCTDGLHGEVPDQSIVKVLERTTPATLEQSCAALIALANESGGRDNVTVLLVAAD